MRCPAYVFILKIMRIVSVFNHIYLVNKLGRGPGLNFRRKIGLGAIYMGTLIGAGFASGQEIISFFTVYGKHGLLGIGFASILFFVLGYLILKQSIQIRSQCLRDILLPIAGERLTLLFDTTMDVFCLAGYSIMLSGCGAVLEESFNFEYMYTIVVLCTIFVWTLSKEFTGLEELNKLLVAVILFLTILIGLTCIKDYVKSPAINMEVDEKGWFRSSVLYVSYNTTLALAVLSALGSYTNEDSVALGAAAIGASGIFATGALMWFITWANYPQLLGVQVPLLRVARRYGNFLFLSSVIVLLSAMMTTALGLGFSFAKSLSQKFGINYRRAIFLLFLGVPLAKYSFAGLINKVYPLLGKLGIIFAILLATKQVFKYLNRMI